jgi:hypothetical protein
MAFGISGTATGGAVIQAYFTTDPLTGIATIGANATIDRLRLIELRVISELLAEGLNTINKPEQYRNDPSQLGVYA